MASPHPDRVDGERDDEAGEPGVGVEGPEEGGDQVGGKDLDLDQEAGDVGDHPEGKGANPRPSYDIDQPPSIYSNINETKDSFRKKLILWL